MVATRDAWPKSSLIRDWWPSAGRVSGCRPFRCSRVPPGLILPWGDSRSVTDQSDRVKGLGAAPASQQRVPRGSPAEAAVAPVVRLDVPLCPFPGSPSFGVDLTGIVPKGLP